MEFSGISKSSSQFSTSENGFVGLGPYHKLTEKGDNLVYQMKHFNVIDNAIVSIFASAQHTSTSSIKFGGWD